MPFYQIVSVTYSSDVAYPNTAGLYNMLGKKVSTLLLEGWVCQGGVAVITDSGTPIEIIQAMTLD
jgi:hypothetical protein